MSARLESIALGAITAGLSVLTFTPESAILTVGPSMLLTANYPLIVQVRTQL